MEETQATKCEHNHTPNPRPSRQQSQQACAKLPGESKESDVLMWSCGRVRAAASSAQRAKGA
jgi:hypothetical protein